MSIFDKHYEKDIYKGLKEKYKFSYSFDEFKRAYLNCGNDGMVQFMLNNKKPILNKFF